MSDNVIKFQKRKPVKPPRQTPPWLRKLLVIAIVVIVFFIAFGYFYITGPANP